MDDKKDYSGNERRIGMLQFAIPLALVGFVCVAVLVHQATRRAPRAKAKARTTLTTTRSYFQTRMAFLRDFARMKP